MTYQPTRQEQADLRQRASRAEVSLTCEVRQGQRPWAKVLLHDISETGFRIDWRPGFDIGKPIYVKIPGLQLLNAMLRWKREGMIGCEFTSKLYAPVYDHIVRQSQIEG
ncbi:MAG: PilZ domain-containing protein [Novosphingobium sp.]